jgi:hypothetical protein
VGNFVGNKIDPMDIDGVFDLMAGCFLLMWQFIAFIFFSSASDED